MSTMPLFPLSTVMFPGGYMPLQIFEPRYVDMVRDCMRQQGRFVISQLIKGSEVAVAAGGMSPQWQSLGCSVEIVDWAALPHGRLGITVKGCDKVEIGGAELLPSGLRIADVELLPPEPDCEVPEDYLELVEILLALSEHASIQALGIDVDYNSSLSVANHLAQLLPFPSMRRQDLLQLSNPLDRLQAIAKLVADLQS